MHKYFVGFLLLVSLHAQALLTEATSERDARIENPNLCSDIMGAGGNYRETQFSLQGKCEGAGLAPQIVGSKEFLRHMVFRTNPSIRSAKDRTELAFANRYIPFDQTTYIGLRLMIPAGASVTNDFFYLLQLWQCSPASPIAGIRISRGSSHKLDFLMRGDSADRTAVSYDLHPDVWHAFVIRIVANSTGGSMKIWSDNRLVGEWRGPIGFNAIGKCLAGQRPPQHFRPKFGIYKGNEPGRAFEARFDDVRIGDTFTSVVPW